MITTEQWRVRIGCFSQPTRCRNSDGLNESNKRETSVTSKILDLNYRLLITAICAWAFSLGTSGLVQVFEWGITEASYDHGLDLDIHLPPMIMINGFSQTTCIYTLSPHVNLLILSNDVETNPGPTDKEFSSAMEKLLGEMQKLRHEMNSNFEGISSDLNEVKREVSGVKEEMQQIKENQSIIQSDMETLAMNAETVEDKVVALSEEIEKMEQYSRRENVILYGINEDENETAIKSTEKVLKLLNENVTTRQWNKRDIVRAHRVGSKANRHDRSRPMIVRLQFFADKFDIFNAREVLKTLNISVANDLTKFQREQLRKVRNDGKKGYYRNGKLIVEDVTLPKTNNDQLFAHETETGVHSNDTQRATSPVDHPMRRHSEIGSTNERTWTGRGKAMTTRSKQHGKRDSNK